MDDHHQPFGLVSRKVTFGFLLLLMCLLGLFTNMMAMDGIKLYINEMIFLSSNQPKYLLYFSQAGWANQQRCLQNAYVFAKLLNRTLLLPPVLPHKGLGATNQQTVLEPGGLRFKEAHDNNTDPFYHYLQRLPNNRYLPMTDVVDINVSLPGVQTLDAKVFRQEYYHENLTTATIEIDYGYSHYNTMWLYQNPRLEGLVTKKKIVEYGTPTNVSRTHRDIFRTLGSRSSPDLLVLLDSFKLPLHETTRDSVPPWRPRMTRSIRDSVRSRTKRWPPYAAVHLRTGDGPFLLRVEETIRKSLAGVEQVLKEWLLRNKDSLAADNDRRIGLYVATDLRDFREHEVFSAIAKELMDNLYYQHQVNLTLLSLQDVGNATQILGDGMLYADIFLDLQVSVCAPIGFVKSYFSSFSELIETHRLSEDEAC